MYGVSGDAQISTIRLIRIAIYFHLANGQRELIEINSFLIALN